MIPILAAKLTFQPNSAHSYHLSMYVRDLEAAFGCASVLLLYCYPDSTVSRWPSWLLSCHCDPLA